MKYNPDSTISGATFNNIYYNYDYNIEGLLKRKSASGKTLLEYTYDKNNNIKTIQDITGKYSKYTYDKADRLRTIQDEKDNVQAQYGYFGNNNIKSVTLGNGVKSDYTYDGDGNVASLVTVTSNGEVLVDYNYAYDLNGNRLQKVSSKHKNFYSYDSMNRLVNSSYDDRKESFTYDKVGNRLTKITNDITEKYVYNVKNQLKEVYREKGNSTQVPSLSKFDLAKYKIWSLTYDKQGNTLREETTTGNNLFEYNTLNQQVKAITKDGNTLVNRYDAEGLRYEIEENEALSKFIFNRNGDTLVELNKDNEVVSRFTRGYEVVSADVDSNRYYYSVDEQGSTEFITDVASKVKNQYYYDAFGNILDSKEDIHNRITYTGQQFDEITQQYYLRARFYNPVIGRFTQEDEYRGDGLNLYAYCRNNPVSYYDPSGYSLVEYIPNLFDSKVKSTSSSTELAYNILKEMGVDVKVIKDSKTGSHQAQHIIPQDVFKKSEFLKEIGFQIDNHNNGIWDINKDSNESSLYDLINKQNISSDKIERYVSDNTHHRGYHSLYSKEVKKQVKQIEKEMRQYKKELKNSGMYTKSQIKDMYIKKSREEIESLTEDLRQLNKSGIDMYKNDSSNKKNWGKEGEEAYSRYFQEELSKCSSKSRSFR